MLKFCLNKIHHNWLQLSLFILKCRLLLYPGEHVFNLQNNYDYEIKLSLSKMLTFVCPRSATVFLHCDFDIHVDQLQCRDLAVVAIMLFLLLFLPGRCP